MYRDWREVTKTLLLANSKGELDSTSLPKSKLRRPETRLYIAWVRKEIATNPERFEMFEHGKGIIATRERFLKHLEQEGFSGSEQITASLDAINLEKEAPKKVIIAPISVQGCGKTTISVALCHLFNFGHVQSDNFKKKGGFLKEVQKQLSKYDVVIADKFVDFLDFRFYKFTLNCINLETTIAKSIARTSRSSGLQSVSLL